MERKIVVNIFDGVCEDCRFLSMGMFCLIFRIHIKSSDNGFAIRCQECLDAEVKDNSRKPYPEVGPYTGRTILDIELNQE